MAANVDVVIIGAGAAGVTAARRLAASHLAAIVLEATARVGASLDLRCRGLPLGRKEKIFIEIMGESSFTPETRVTGKLAIAAPVSIKSVHSVGK